MVSILIAAAISFTAVSLVYIFGNLCAFGIRGIFRVLDIDDIAWWLVLFFLLTAVLACCIDAKPDKPEIEATLNEKTQVIDIKVKAQKIKGLNIVTELN